MIKRLIAFNIFLFLFLGYCLITAVNVQANEEAHRYTEEFCGYDSWEEIPVELTDIVYSEIPLEFKQCNQDDDCVLAQSFCNSYEAVNKRIVSCFEAAARLFDTMADCADTIEEVSAVGCVNQVCVKTKGDKYANSRD